MAGCIYAPLAQAATYNITPSTQNFIGVIEQANPGDLVNAAAGTYNVARTINMKPGVTLRGAAVNSSAFRFDAPLGDAAGTLNTTTIFRISVPANLPPTFTLTNLDGTITDGVIDANVQRTYGVLLNIENRLDDPRTSIATVIENIRLDGTAFFNYVMGQYPYANWRDYYNPNPGRFGAFSDLIFTDNSKAIRAVRVNGLTLRKLSFRNFLLVSGLNNCNDVTIDTVDCLNNGLFGNAAFYVGTTSEYVIARDSSKPIDSAGNVLRPLSPLQVQLLADVSNHNALDAAYIDAPSMVNTMVVNLRVLCDGAYEPGKSVDMSAYGENVNGVNSAQGVLKNVDVSKLFMRVTTERPNYQSGFGYSAAFSVEINGGKVDNQRIHDCNVDGGFSFVTQGITDPTTGQNSRTQVYRNQIIGTREYFLETYGDCDVYQNYVQGGAYNVGIFGGATPIRNIRMQNNIFLNQFGGGYAPLLHIGESQLYDWVISNNRYYMTSPADASWIYHSDRTSGQGKTVRDNQVVYTSTSAGVSNSNLNDFKAWAIQLDPGTIGNSYVLNNAFDPVAAEWTFQSLVNQSIQEKIEAENCSAVSGMLLEQCSDTGAGENLGYIEAGDWVDYQINVPTAGSYNLDLRVASGATGGNLTLSAGGGSYNVSFSATGGWQTWTTIRLSNVSLLAGNQSIRITANNDGWNLNYFQFLPSSLINNAVYELAPRHAPSQRLNVAGTSGSANAAVQIWADINSNSQRWKIEEQGAGTGIYELIPQHATTMRLGVNGGSSSNGALCVQSTDVNSSNQRWKLEAQADGSYELIPQNSTARRLNVVGGGTSNGTRAEIRTDNNSASMRWNLLRQ